MTLFALVYLLSAAQAPAYADLAGVFAVRMVVMAGFAWLVAGSPAGHRPALRSLAGVACLLAAVATLEAAGLRSIDPLLDRFREMPFDLAGSRRATAFSEYPNLAAGFMMCGLVAGVGLLAERSPSPWPALPFSALMAAGLLATYSRGAMVAATLGLLVLSITLATCASRRAALPVAAALAVLGVSAGLFTLTREVYRLRLGSEGTSRWYVAAYEPVETSLRLRPGELTVTPVRVTNNGRKTWSRTEAFYLTYHWWHLDRSLLEEGERTHLPHDLGPGESALLQARVRAPSREGRFLLAWDMVHEYTTWFSDQGVPPLVIPAVVGEANAEPAADLTIPRVESDFVWRPGRWELWRLALAMWKERPLLGVGADNFRRLYGPQAGHAMWDKRVYANNLYLEVAATTGALGLLAACGILVSAGHLVARAVWRGQAGAHMAAVECGLLAAIAAHGMVDYLLASTGHYLLLALIVGIAAATAQA